MLHNGVLSAVIRGVGDVLHNGVLSDVIRGIRMRRRE